MEGVYLHNRIVINNIPMDLNIVMISMIVWLIKVGIQRVVEILLFMLVQEVNLTPICSQEENTLMMDA